MIARENHGALPDSFAFGPLLDCLPDPVLLLARNDSAWLNPPAQELESWLREGDSARTLATELRATIMASATPTAAGSQVSIPLTLRQQSGAERAFQMRIVPDTSQSGDRFVICVLLSVIGAENTNNLLEAKVQSEIAKARLEDVQQQLLQADRLSSIGQLAAGVAHEINNPIGYVQSNLGTLRDYVTSLFRLIGVQESALRHLRNAQPEQLMQIEEVRQQIDFDFLAKDLPILLAESLEGISRVRKIIQDLREFSRAGHSESWTVADIHAGIDSTINIVWNDLKYKVELVKDYGDIPAIECLPYQLNQVFMNILVNAGHAIEERGQIKISTRADGGVVYVEISDNGKGIAPEHLGRVFEPFFTTKPIGKGTGLGLSISYGIVRKHGGQIDVRSEIGEGTTFLIKLPVQQQSAAASAAT